MSGGVDTERIYAVALAAGVAQKVLGDKELGIDSGGGGGGVTQKREDLLNEAHIGGGHTVVNGPTSTCSSTTSTSNNKKRVRRHNHNIHHKKQQSLRKRIRRNTQPAPNNTNEFLMKEHDHLFHLDLDNEEWDPNHSHPGPGHPGDDLSVQVNLTHASYQSSSDDEDAFLHQDFSAMYDVVHQERLNVMSKPELIMEYQLLEERVESLERTLKSSLRSRPDLVSPLPPPQAPVSIDLLSEDEKIRLVQEEVTSLREENRKLRADNKFLKKLYYSPSPALSAVVNEGDDRVSTDSGGGSGSGSDTATPEKRNINKMIQRL